jgi:L-aspartate oxidase
LSLRLPPRNAIDPGASASINGPLLNPAERVDLRSAMSRHVGVLRTPHGLRSALGQLAALGEATTTEVTGSRRAWEATNMLTVAGAVVTAARTRTESRGCHRRTDWTEPREIWLTHLTLSIDPNGDLVVDGVPEGA